MVEESGLICYNDIDRAGPASGNEYYIADCSRIPIAMIGAAGEEQYPLTNITLAGAALNILPPEAMEEMYYSGKYAEMESFPGETSVRIIDGLCMSRRRM